MLAPRVLAPSLSDLSELLLKQTLLLCQTFLRKPAECKLGQRLPQAPEGNHNSPALTLLGPETAKPSLGASLEGKQPSFLTHAFM